MSHVLRLAVFVTANLLFFACGKESLRPSPIDASLTKEEWNDVNDPLHLRDDYIVNLNDLPLSGELERKPWTDSYWPNYRGGLAYRWNDDSQPDAFDYPLMTRDEVTALLPEKLEELSPAEKYDVFKGNFDYPLVTHERDRTSPDDPSWFGLCHGWAPAALNFDEPKPIVLEGHNGIRVPFGSSDIKALLMYAQQEGTNTRFAGDRCNAEGEGSEEIECRDINAGSFHVIVANQIALLGKGFVAEVYRGAQVWNHPAYGFSSAVVSETTDVYPNAAPGTVRIATVETYLRYVVELGANWEPMPFDQFPQQEADRRYEYTLEINADGEIIGGEWRSDDHPDFVWTQDAPSFRGYFRELKEIYEAATNNL